MFDAEKIAALLRKYQPGTDWEIPGGATPDRVAAYEQELGFGFPDDFKAWVMLTNGPTISGNFNCYFGVPGALNGAFDKEYELIPIWRERQWIPICQNGSGCYCAMPTQQEFGEGFPILYFDIDKGFKKPTCFEASDLQHFLEQQIEEAFKIHTQGLLSIYDPNPEVRKKRIQESDPAILNFHGARYPWEV